nr:retinoblastoma-related protein isoform X1 [Ipomoea batatas]
MDSIPQGYPKVHSAILQHATTTHTMQPGSHFPEEDSSGKCAKPVAVPVADWFVHQSATSLRFPIVKLAAVRINGMVERLQLPQHIRENVYCLFQKILNHHITLFVNRHIDQIILFCFYGVAKISQLNLTFKEIIYNYRKQPHCKPQVFRSVYVDWTSARRNGKMGPDHVDIIAFYNEIFIPDVKPLLVELAPTGAAQKNKNIAEATNSDDGQCPMSPKTSPFPSLPDMSPKKVSATRNVYVSPLRSSKVSVFLFLELVNLILLLSPSILTIVDLIHDFQFLHVSPSTFKIFFTLTLTCL